MSAEPAANEFPALLLTGPTGSGKSGLAVRLALRHGGAVINLDSRQIYRDFPIITAQPSPEEQAAAPHLGYGFLDSAAKMTAGAYARLAAGFIADVRRQGRLPILVGGTGLYIQALLEGIAAIPPVPGDIVRYWRLRMAGEGASALHRELARKDPAYAAKIHPNDRQRIARALEVQMATNRPFSWWHARGLAARPEGLVGMRVFKLGLGLPLAGLEPRLKARLRGMLAAGAVSEAEQALQRCGDPAAPGWSGIGCAELLAYLRGESSLADAQERWFKHTRAYAKRQITWFRRDPGLHWFSPEQTAAAEKAVRVFLENDLDQAGQVPTPLKLRG